jgi:hypothetical protein
MPTLFLEDCNLRTQMDLMDLDLLRSETHMETQDTTTEDHGIDTATSGLQVSLNKLDSKKMISKEHSGSLWNFLLKTGLTSIWLTSLIITKYPTRKVTPRCFPLAKAMPSNSSVSTTQLCKMCTLPAILWGFIECSQRSIMNKVHAQKKQLNSIGTFTPSMERQEMNRSRLTQHKVVNSVMEVSCTLSHYQLVST